MNILIVYGTSEGQTRKISHYMADVLTNAGNKVTIADASEDPPAPKGYDAILIGASIHINNYQSSVKKYIYHHIAELQKMPGAFFSVCLAVASDLQKEHKEAEKITYKFLEQIGWKPLMTIQIAGALRYTQYNFFKKLIMKMIAKKEGRITDTSRDYEYTNWEAVKIFVTGFAERIVLNQ